MHVGQLADMGEPEYQLRGGRMVRSGVEGDHEGDGAAAGEGMRRKPGGMQLGGGS
jgi:hypothetical protein